MGIINNALSSIFSIVGGTTVLLLLAFLLLLIILSIKATQILTKAILAGVIGALFPSILQKIGIGIVEVSLGNSINFMVAAFVLYLLYAGAGMVLKSAKLLGELGLIPIKAVSKLGELVLRIIGLPGKLGGLIFGIGKAVKKKKRQELEIEKTEDSLEEDEDYEEVE